MPEPTSRSFQLDQLILDSWRSVDREHTQPWTPQSGGKKRRTLGRKDQHFQQQGGQAFPRSWFRLTLSVLMWNHLPILVLPVKTLVRLVFSQQWNQVPALIIKNYKGVSKAYNILCLPLLHYGFIEGHIFYPGETAHVCLSQDNEFICPTTNTSTNLTCDKDRCPLQGPPMAPVMEPQSLTGWPCFGFQYTLCQFVTVTILQWN